MAYGNTGSISSAYLDLLAGTVDEWLTYGDNAIDLFSSHAPFMAILRDNSMQPGGDFSYIPEDMSGGVDWRIPVFGRGIQGANAPAGITRANLVNALTPAIPSDLTNIKWVKSLYRGMLTDDYVRQDAQQGKFEMVNQGQMMVNQIEAQFFDQLETDMFDNAAGSESKIQSVNACLLNTGTVGGVDQTDTTNNSWWRAVQDTTTEIWNLPTWNRVYFQTTIDTPVPTGVSRGAPDTGFLYGDQYALAHDALIQSQRLEYGKLTRGGAEFIEANGVRFFRTTRTVANTSLGLNSKTWSFRSSTKSPMPVTAGFVPDPNRPGIWTRGYLWRVSLGTKSCKHNFLLTNKLTS